MEEHGTAVNIASFSGHGSIRAEVMGDDFERSATADEIENMKELLVKDLEAGALGMSTGLEYDPGIYSTTEEVVELAKVVASHGGRYVSHIRSEDGRFWEAIDEVVNIGRQAQLPVRISHLKLAMTSSHGQTDRLLGLLDQARADGVDVTADIYPYTYWQSTLTVMFPDRNFEDREAALFAVEELSTPEEMLIPDFGPDPSLAGKTLAEIAALRGTDPGTTLIDLIREAEAMRAEKRARGEDEDIESIIAVSMTEADIERLIAWPHINICTDGDLDGSHPRGLRCVPTRSRPLCPGATGPDPRGGHPPHDGTGRVASRNFGAGAHRTRDLCRPRALRSRHGGRSIDNRRAPRSGHRYREGVG